MGGALEQPRWAVFSWYNAGYMKIQTFDTTAEANTFIDTVLPTDLQYIDNTIVVYYNEKLSIEEQLEKDRQDKLEEAGLNIKKTEKHLELLTKMLEAHTEAGNTDSIKEVEKSIKQSEASLLSWNTQYEVAKAG